MANEDGTPGSAQLLKEILDVLKSQSRGGGGGTHPWEKGLTWKGERPPQQASAKEKAVAKAGKELEKAANKLEKLEALLKETKAPSEGGLTKEELIKQKKLFDPKETLIGSDQDKPKTKKELAEKIEKQIKEAKDLQDRKENALSEETAKDEAQSEAEAATQGKWKKAIGGLSKKVGGWISGKMIGFGLGALALEVESFKKSAFLIQQDYTDVMDRNADQMEGIPGHLFHTTKELIDAQRAGFEGIGRSYLNLSKENKLLTGSNAALHETMHAVATTMGMGNNRIEVLSKHVSEAAVGYKKATVDLLNGLRALMQQVGTRLAAMGAPDQLINQAVDLQGRLAVQYHGPLVESLRILTGGIETIGFQARFGFLDLADQLHTTQNLTGDLNVIVERFGADLDAYRAQHGGSILGFTAAFPAFMGLTEEQVMNLDLLRRGMQGMQGGLDNTGKQLTKHGQTLGAQGERLRGSMSIITSKITDVAASMDNLAMIAGNLIPILISMKIAMGARSLMQAATGAMAAGTAGAATGGMATGLLARLGGIGTAAGFATGTVATLGIGAVVALATWGLYEAFKSDPATEATGRGVIGNLEEIKKNTTTTSEGLRQGFTSFTDTAADLVDRAIREAMFKGTELEDANKMTQEQIIILRDISRSVKNIGNVDPFI